MGRLKYSPSSFQTKSVNLNLDSNQTHLRILCHVCCGPCSIFPLKTLLGADAEVWGYFYNPNIHPLAEFKKRLEAVKTLSALLSVKMLYNEEYRPVEFIRQMKASVGGSARSLRSAKETVGGLKISSGSGERVSEYLESSSESKNGISEIAGIPPHGLRCVYCYATRLEATAKAAKEAGFAAFTSSLLYSRYQDHEEIRRAGTEIGERIGLPFYYVDFRGGWQAGIDESKSMGLYRQKYCGCIYSRIERYAKKKGG